MVPLIVVRPASLTVGGAVSSASFAVVARSKTPVTYAWTRDGKPVGGNQPYLKLTDLGGAQQSVIQVNLTNAAGSVSASARLTVGLTTPKSQHAGSDGVTSLYTKVAWWVYWVEALGATPDKDLKGYWILRRTLSGTDGSQVVTPGEALWVLGNRAAPTGVPFTDRWDATEQFVLDAMDSESAEFSVFAQRALESATYAIAGRVEPSGEAALYGAPEMVEGSSEGGVLGQRNLSLAWDSEQVLFLEGNTDLEKAKIHLQGALSIQAAAIAGE